MIATLLKEAMMKQGLSARQTAKLTGISHGTIDRILNGEWIDLETLVKLCNWLGVSPATALDTLGEGTDAVVSAIATIIEAQPKLAKTFLDAARDVKDGKLSPDDLRDIVAYAAYRINIARADEPGHAEVPEGNRSGV